MLLAIDVGNTNTVVGVYDDQRLVHHFRLSSDRNRTADEYGVLLKSLLAGVNVQAAVLASVVPPLTPVFERTCKAGFQVTPLVIGPGIKTGMPILYESPREVGADRIVNGV